MKYCQGPLCHTYDTKDRKRGTKGNKVNQTRRRTSMYYLSGNACSLNCANDWFEEFGNRAIDYFGRITQPMVLTEDNAWRKRYRYNWERENNETEYYSYNIITNEERDLTDEQYSDSNYTLNT